MRVANSRLLYTGSCLCLEGLQLLLGGIVVLASSFADLFQILYSFLVLPSNLVQEPRSQHAVLNRSGPVNLTAVCFMPNGAGPCATVGTELNKPTPACSELWNNYTAIMQGRNESLNYGSSG